MLYVIFRGGISKNMGELEQSLEAFTMKIIDIVIDRNRN